MLVNLKPHYSLVSIDIYIHVHTLIDHIVQNIVHIFTLYSIDKKKNFTCALLFQHGESICNVYGLIGGNSELSEQGRQV